MAVAYHRGRLDKIKGTCLYNKYCNMAKEKDMIIGSIANDRMFYVIDNFFIGNITDAALVNSLSALELGKQYVAITQKACDAVKIECEVELSYLERQFLKDVAGDKLSESGEIYSKDVLYWMGYLYRYWHYYTNEDSVKIYRQASVGTMKRNYLMFHTMAPEMAIEDLKEISGQKSF